MSSLDGKDFCLLLRIVLVRLYFTSGELDLRSIELVLDLLMRVFDLKVGKMFGYEKTLSIFLGVKRCVASPLSTFTLLISFSLGVSFTI